MFVFRADIFSHFYINAFHVYISPVTSVWITGRCSRDDIWRQGDPATRSRQSINQRKIIRNTFVPPRRKSWPAAPQRSRRWRCNCSRELESESLNAELMSLEHSKNGKLQHFGQTN